MQAELVEELVEADLCLTGEAGEVEPQSLLHEDTVADLRDGQDGELKLGAGRFRPEQLSGQLAVQHPVGDHRVAIDS